jgi:hypothetical protein
MSAATVTITRCHHPLQGRSLVVLGRIHRHGRLELLLVLPDGSKTLIPAVWTDHAGVDHGAAHPSSADTPATLGSVTDLWAACELVSALSARRDQAPEQAARKSPSKEDSHAARTADSAAGLGSDATNHPIAHRVASRIAGRGGGGPVGDRNREDRDAGER